MEDSITASLNLYDIAVRLIPGAVFLYGCAYFGIVPLCVSDDSAVALFQIFVLSYVAGTLLRGIARFFDLLVNKVAYGGNPRDCYLTCSSRDDYQSLLRRFVLHEQDEINLGLDCRGVVAKCCGFDSVTSGFAFGFMINYLEANNQAIKSDRMCSLSEMCSSLNAMFLLLALISLIKWHLRAFIVLSACAVLSGYLRIYYEEVRYKTVIRTFAVTYSRNKPQEHV